MNDELIILLKKAYDDGIITSIIQKKILKAKEDLHLSDAEFTRLDDQIRIETYVRKVEERKEQGIFYVGDLTKQYKITEEEKISLQAKKDAEPIHVQPPVSHPVPHFNPQPVPQHTQAAPSSEHSVPSHTGLVAVIVDDNPNHSAHIKKILEGDGFICHTADSPEEAYKLAVQMKPVIIFSDFNFGIGKRTGLDFFHELKSKKMMIPFIIISAYFQREFVDYALGVGVTDYLTKPVAPEVLLSTVKEHLDAPKKN